MHCYFVAAGASSRAATLTVKSGADCTLRKAIATAVAGDTIDFAVLPEGKVTLTSGELLIEKALYD